MKLILSVIFLSIAGCASFPGFKEPSASYVAPEVNSFEAEDVARDMAGFLAEQMPAAKTTIALEPSKALLHEILSAELKQRGFGVIDGDAKPDEQAVAVRYFVTILDGGVLVRMMYRKHLAGRYYARLDGGKLSFSNRFSVREEAQ